MLFIAASAYLHLIKDIKEAVAYYISIRNDRWKYEPICRLHGLINYYTALDCAWTIVL